MNTALGAASFYAALLIVGAIALQWNVILNRRRAQVGIGTGDDRQLERAIRVHGNFVENVPLAIGAMALMAMASAAWPVHLVGLLMIAGRVLHAIGLSGSGGISAGRFGGMALTQLSLLLAAFFLLMRVL